MAEQVVVDGKSDDLDIVSIGKPYQGPWEKKYWSSSRGKDRHPYPVGYAALRTCNGNTYKMAILEGLKGPEFTISSTDGESCSGQTPDIAWDGFQKKSCVRIKFWRGKRFSCKIDGAELFGFKNPLVKRLLRGLKANVSEIVEQSSPSSCLGNGQSKEAYEHHTQCTVYCSETCKYSDSKTNIVKTKDKVKKSRKRKDIHVKSVSEAEHKRGRPQDQIQNGEGNHNKGIPSTLSTSNENNTGLETMAEGGNNSAEDRVQIGSSVSNEHFEDEKCLAAQEAKDHISSKDAISSEEGINLLENKENLDRLMCTGTPGFTSSKTVHEKENTPVPKDSQIPDDVDLYAPDTLDLTLDNTCNPEVEIPKESTCTMNDKLHAAQNLDSEKCATESNSKDEIKDEMVIAAGSENSEKSDSDPVGHEIAESMMTLLLPRALPLLNTYTRKKKTSPSCRRKHTHGMSHEERKGTDQSLEDEPPAKSSSTKIQLEKLNGKVHIPDELFTESKQNENVIFPSTDMCSLVPSLEDSTAVAPDSFENDQCELMECSRVGVYPNIQQSEEKSHIGTESNQHVDWVLEDRPEKGSKIMTDYDLGNMSPSRKDLCTHSDDTPFFEAYPKHTDVKVSHCFTEDVCGASVNCEGQPQATGCTKRFEIQGHYEADGSISILQDQIISHHDMTKKEETKDELCLNKLTEMVHNDELGNIFELVGCYVHPRPISMIMLRMKGNEVFICVLCGYLMEKDRTLFIYKASIEGERRGCPSFIGHTTVISPISINASGGQISLDSSSLQFTPDGKCLVLLNNIKAPYCREGSVNCQCSVCASYGFEKNAVKVVQLKLGYVQVLCKLRTTNNVCCILVCEPSYLVAAEESGRMNLWTMNPTWSAPTEQSYLPTSDCMPNYVVEMKRLPNFPALIVGHNAFGDFCLWDLKRRILVSKFSSPKTSFLQFLPINVYRCPSQKAKDIMGETKTWSLQTDNHTSFPINEDDAALVLLVSSVTSLDPGVSPVGRWSLALLAKSKLISEKALDPSATIVGASAGYGIVVTREGSLYIWELSTGAKLGYLSHCRGATVSCIATDSDSGAFAVAVDSNQLQVYAPATATCKGTFHAT